MKSYKLDPEVEMERAHTELKDQRESSLTESLVGIFNAAGNKLFKNFGKSERDKQESKKKITVLSRSPQDDYERTLCHEIERLECQVGYLRNTVNDCYSTVCDKSVLGEYATTYSTANF